MYSLFEKQDSLNNPIECFLYNAAEYGLPIKPHWHYFAELIYMLEGAAEITVDSGSYIVRKGELLLLHPSVVHSFMSADGGLPVFAGLKFDLLQFPGNTSYAPPPTDLFKYAAEKEMPVFFDAGTAEKMKCGEIFDNCIDETKSFAYGVDIMLRAQVYRLLYGIERQWIACGLNVNECPVSPADSYGIENISEYIDSHLSENIKVRDIAAKCHISYSGFAARFHARYGMSCKEYIERMRIFKSEEYLLFTDQDLSWISDQTGFSDCSHFIRSFKKYRGITPKQFRMKRKQ